MLWASAHWWTAPRPLVQFLARKFALTDDQALAAYRAAFAAIMARPT
ncbi:hypothetical protein [Mesorhizobium sp. B2-4-14]|nr:hypothetical protein [Mesorhizobium sp. B2-4-14]